MTKKNQIFEQYIANGKSQTDYERLKLTCNSLTETIRSSKEKLYCKWSTKLANPSTSSETYWSILKTFINGKKIPIIPPLLVNDKFITNFLEKANLFNEFFSKQCQLFNTVSCKSEYFKNSFIPNVINEWNKLDPVIRSSTSYNLFCNTLLNFIRPVQRKTFNINDSVGFKLLTRLRLGFSHLREHKFRHGFRDILNPLCPCSIETETTAHYFLRCHFYNANRSSLMDELNEIDISFSTLNENKLIDLILYGSDKFDDKKNYNILMSTIKFIKDSQRFDENLL